MSVAVRRPGVFVREATGLTKEVGFLDVFIYNTNNQNIGLGVLFLVLLMGLYPGGNPYWATVLTVLCVLPVAGVYAMFAGTMPRSGGDYVYVSRVLGPRLGFMVSFNWVFWLLVYIGIPAAYLAQFGLAPLFRAWGALAMKPALVELGGRIYTPGGTILAGGALLTLFLLVFTAGTRLYMRIQNAGFAIAMLSLLLMVAVGLTADPGQFPERFDRFVQAAGGAPGAYQAVMARAAEVGAAAPFSWRQTLLLATWAIYILAFSVTSSFIGGEVKGARKSQLVGMVYSVLFTAAMIMLVLAALERVAGREFLRALGAVPPDTYGLGFTPTILELAAVAAGSLPLALAIGITFLFWTYVWLPINFLASTRALLAWSFDRLLPERVAEVSERFHTPTVANAIVYALGLLSLVLYAKGILSTLSGIAGWLVSYAVTCLAAVVFPYRSRALWEASPYHGTLAGVPWFTVMGVLGLVGLAVEEYVLWADPVAGLGLDTPQARLMRIVSVAVWVAGLLVYELARALQLRRGIDVRAAFREIPPE